MEEREDNGYATLEEAARQDIPPRFARMVGSRDEGDYATVWLLTNDQPPFDEYEAQCFRRNGRWYFESGGGGWSGVPPEVRANARLHGWS